MAKVIAYKNKETGELEDVTSLLRRFKKKVIEDQVIYECKRREYFVPKSLKKKLKAIEAKKRQKKNYKPKY